MVIFLCKKIKILDFLKFICKFYIIMLKYHCEKNSFREFRKC